MQENASKLAMSITGISHVRVPLSSCVSLPRPSQSCHGTRALLCADPWPPSSPGDLSVDQGLCPC